MKRIAKIVGWARWKFWTLMSVDGRDGDRVAVVVGVERGLWLGVVERGGRGSWNWRGMWNGDILPSRRFDVVLMV